MKRRFIPATERRLRRRLALVEHDRAEEQRLRLVIERKKVEVDNLLARLKFTLVHVTGQPLHEVATWPGERVVEEVERRLKTTEGEQ